MEKEKISLIGVGKLGICFGLLLAETGYDVLACDVSEERINQINNKTLKTNEPQVEEMLKTSTIKVINNIKECFDHSNLLFVLVATPSKNTGEYDHSQIDNIVEQLEQHQIKDKTLIINATTMPKYCQSLKEKLQYLNINVIYSPEFIAQGSVIKDYRNADIVLIGGENIPPSIFSIYHNIMIKVPDFKVLSLTGAELAKISINCFLSFKICYGNMIGDLIYQSGEKENIEQILETIGSDSRIGSKYLKYGLPASGVCIPRDLRALNKYYKEYNTGESLIDKVILENEQHLLFLFGKFLYGNQDKNIPFIFSHLTYKQGVDIFTESKPLELAKLFLRSGYKIIVENQLIPEELLEYGENVLTLPSKDGIRVN